MTLGIVTVIYSPVVNLLADSDVTDVSIPSGDPRIAGKRSKSKTKTVLS